MVWSAVRPSSIPRTQRLIAAACTGESWDLMAPSMPGAEHDRRVVPIAVACLMPFDSPGLDGMSRRSQRSVCCTAGRRKRYQSVFSVTATRNTVGLQRALLCVVLRCIVCVPGRQLAGICPLHGGVLAASVGASGATHRHFSCGGPGSSALMGWCNLVPSGGRRTELFGVVFLLVNVLGRCMLGVGAPQEVGP
jgi:hypothetical protein